MAEITNPLLQLINGKPSTVAAGDTIPQSKITSLVSDLSSLNSGVSAAQADATQALSDAAAAQSTADSAFSAAQAAQSDATQALADAAGAQGTADSAVTAAAAAQSDATQALADAAAAQSTADGAVSDAAAAQSTADSAASAAAAAQSDATQALADAAAAQADATQALSDAAAAMAEATAAHSDATQALADAAAAQATADAALPASGGTISGDLAVTGDLNVTGNIVSKGTVNVLISDSFLDLNSGNTVTADATAGGFTVNVKASGSPLTATAFVAGVVSTSAPSFATSGSSLVAGDIVQVSGSTDGKNDGLYVVASGSSATVVYIKGIGGTSVDLAKTPFAKNQFVAQSAQTATVTKVDLAVLAASNGLIQGAAGAIPAGTFCYVYAAAANESLLDEWTSITEATIPTLQQVLAAGSSLGSANKLNYSLETQANTDLGCVVYIDSAGVCQKLSSAVADGEIAGVTLSQSDTGNNSSVGVASVVGQIVLVKAKAGDVPAKGDTVYVSSMAGSIGKTAPTSGRIIKFGKCVGDVSGSLYPCLLQPQLIADISV